MEKDDDAREANNSRRFVLVLNAGSSTVKYDVFQVSGDSALTLTARGLVQRIGEGSDASLSLSFGEHEPFEKSNLTMPDHRAAMDQIVSLLTSTSPGDRVIPATASIIAVGHRVVHGGPRFTCATVVTDAVIQDIRKTSDLAPLHNPPSLAGIEVARLHFPAATHVAVFDTAFHHTLPPAAKTYALPKPLMEAHSIQRYGFHGTSHEFVAKRAAQFLGRPFADCRLISLHLGNGCSACAIANGVSVDTSMGLSPLEGLVMGTRSGDLDASILTFLSRHAGMSPSDLDALLNHKSGLKGLCGFNDMRDVIRESENGNSAAGLALEVFCYRIKKYIGSYFAALGGADAIIFTAGIGEHAAAVRQKSCEGLACLGVELLQEANRDATKLGERVADISAASSRVRVLVVPTNEELSIALQTLACHAALGS